MNIYTNNHPGTLYLIYHLSLAHIHHATDAVSALHLLKRAVDLGQRLAMRDELVHLEISLQVVVHQAG